MKDQSPKPQASNERKKLAAQGLWDKFEKLFTAKDDDKDRDQKFFDKYNIK